MKVKRGHGLCIGEGTGKWGRGERGREWFWVLSVAYSSSPGTLFFHLSPSIWNVSFMRADIFNCFIIGVGTCQIHIKLSMNVCQILNKRKEWAKLSSGVTTWISGDGQKSWGACGIWGLSQYLGYALSELFLLKRKHFIYKPEMTLGTLESVSPPPPPSCSSPCLWLECSVLSGHFMSSVRSPPSSPLHLPCRTAGSALHSTLFPNVKPPPSV